MFRRCQKRVSWSWILLAVLADATGPTPAGWAQASRSATDAELKAAYVYSFAKFVEWPDSALGGEHAPLVIGVLDDEDLSAVLEEMIAGKTVRGRPLRVTAIASLERLKVCHILFIGVSQREKMALVLKVLDGAPVLTIASVEEFCRRGGVIELYLVERRYRFKVNVEAARRSGLRISSQLLKLAHEVTTG